MARALVASVGVTTPSGGSPADEIWRRPAPDEPAGLAGAANPVAGRPDNVPGPTGRGDGPGPAGGPVPATNPGPAGGPIPATNPGPTGGPGPAVAGAGATDGEPHQPWAGRSGPVDQAWARGAQPQPPGSAAPTGDSGWARPTASPGPAGAWPAGGQPGGGWARGGPGGGWAGGGPGGGYAGPPANVPPPPGWRPPLYVQPAPPRRLPPQDMAAMDHAEQQAQRVTYGLGGLAAVVLVVLVCLLCSRVLF